MNKLRILEKCSILKKNPTNLLPKTVRIVEVGPRDGLQNESTVLSPEFKAQMVSSLLNCGIRHIETGAFVSPKWVPQMADSDKVLSLVKAGHIPENTILSSLVPNMKGMQKGIIIIL
jgi:hydroxymethylglutaryl-CoA lyase